MSWIVATNLAGLPSSKGAQEAGFDVGERLSSTHPLHEIARVTPIGLEDADGAPGDLVGPPPEDAFECRIAAQDALIRAEQRDADRRGIQDGLQFGGGAPQF